MMRKCPQILAGITMSLLLSSPLLAQMGPAAVEIAPVVEQRIATGKTFLGNVQPVRKSIVGSAVDGRVVELPVEEGDAVEKGKPLAQLRTKTIEAEVAAARAELELRKQELAELENGTRPEEVAQKKAAMLASEARMSYARKDLDRIQRLYEGQTAANDELDEALSRAAETHQEFLGATAAYDEAVAGARKEIIEQSRAQMEQQQHEVARLEDMLAKYSIVAPFDGYVTEKRTEVGEWVMQGQPIAEVIELKDVDVVALVPENDVHRLQVGMDAAVRVPSLVSRNFTGTIAYIVPQADVQSRSFPVKVRVDNAAADGTPILKSGMLAEVTFLVGDSEPTLLVPKDAVVLGGPVPTVFVFQPNADDPKFGTVQPVSVKLGQYAGDMVAVEGEVMPGQMVVVRGNERLLPGQPVHVSDSSESERLRTAENGQTRAGS